MTNLETISKNYNSILKNVGNNAKIIAVTKYYGLDEMKMAYQVGIRDFAESRALEAIKKINELEDDIRLNSTYHFIGHLQTNKVKHVVSNFDYIHSVDSLKLAVAISKEAKERNIVQKILIQVNNADEESKHGTSPIELDNLIKEISQLENIKIEGLMNIAPLTKDELELKKLFKQMYELKEKYGFKELSMGMSNDYQIAIQLGATMIRLGRILFE